MTEAEKAYQYFVIAVPENEEQAKAYFWARKALQSTLTPPNEWVRVRHGRWILEREPDGTPYCFHCSVCDNDFHHIGIMTATDYCPNCGARMDIVGEEFIC